MCLGYVEAAQTRRTSARNRKKREPADATCECERLCRHCDAIASQAAQAPDRQQAMARREALQEEYDAADAAGTDFKRIAELGLALEQLDAESEQLPLAEEDYLALADRHAALVRRIEDKCAEFRDEEHFDALLALGTKLATLRAIDLSVCAPAAAGTGTETESATGAAGSGLYVPHMSSSVRAYRTPFVCTHRE